MKRPIVIIRALVPRSPARTGQSANDSAASLLTLGKRMERLFFTGLVLTAISFAEMYVTAANEAFSQDRSLVAISAFLKRVEGDRTHLQSLFDTKAQPAPQAPAAPTPADSKRLNEREHQILLAREKLGLPPPKPQPPVSGSSPVPPVETYTSALQELASKAVREDHAADDVLVPYKKPAVAPADLAKQLANDKASIEKQPFNVWGIRTPRLLGFQYGGASFEFPYLFVASALIVLLPALIAGWLSSIYMTRQRELNEIVKARSFSAVFPHVLNFVPVNIRRISGKSYSKKEMLGGIVILALMRIIVIAILIVPMLIAYTYSMIHIWQYSSAVNLALPFSFYIVWIVLGICLQELIGLGGKYFDEA